MKKLAERSKQAANEIINLAQTSVSVTEEAEKLMENIEPDIKKTATIVNEISISSQEQNNGAAQISDAIQKLNMVTQQNTSSVEEIAANAEQLSMQANNLSKVISFFNLNK